MRYNTVVEALTGCFRKPLNKLRRDRRTIAETYIKNWASLSPADREKLAKKIDWQGATRLRITLDRARRKQKEEAKTPLGIAEKDFGWWNGSLEAAAWWEQDNVSFKNAAMLLCCHNPRAPYNTEDQVERSTMLDDTLPNGKSRNITPADYRRLRDAFNAKVHTASDRTLAYWLALAQEKNLRYHGWIDQWLKARAFLIAREDETNTHSSHSKAAPAESKPKIDTSEKSLAPAILDGEPPLQPGHNSREKVKAWVKWQSKILKSEDDTGDALAERIRLLAEKRGYKSTLRALSKPTIIKLLPAGITGGRGKLRGKSKK